jgi:hypothetical protein
MESAWTEVRGAIVSEHLNAWNKTKLGPTVRFKRRLAYHSLDASNRDTNDSKSETKLEGTPLLS